MCFVDFAIVLVLFVVVVVGDEEAEVCPCYVLKMIVLLQDRSLNGNIRLLGMKRLTFALIFFLLLFALIL